MQVFCLFCCFLWLLSLGSALLSSLESFEGLPAIAVISLSWPLIVNPGGETVSLSEVLAKESVHVVGSWLAHKPIAEPVTNVSRGSRWANHRLNSWARSEHMGRGWGSGALSMSDYYARKNNSGWEVDNLIPQPRRPQHCFWWQNLRNYPQKNLLLCSVQSCTWIPWTLAHQAPQREFNEW